MTSSALTGERRLASSRRSVMTVLGKVSVPKPINLPSQRLENHGLDPNVEIVPKGTLSWGSKSSSSTSNPWGSLSQSPHTDGCTSSPSHLNGRPSSGGSGTRPSTAGSDRAHESTATPWGPNSRPSSASGAVTSNQSPLVSLRPGSAEKRPSSSHLSRFAEVSSENPVAWSSAATAEKLGVVHNKDEGFALTSGDFPMLGSEKGNSGKITDSQDHESSNRPGSSSGGVALIKERTETSEADYVSQNESVKSATVNSWRRDNHPYGEDGARYGTEKWQGHSQPYAGANMISPPYDSWSCIPANTPQSGVWYRGPPLGGPTYGTPAPPGSFPMEPFPYYHPHISASPLANHQPVHPPGVGPRGQHPQTGDVYRHPIPDAFVRPTMPIRPGFFRGPVPYNGYYGPSMGYVNERDAPFPGMVGGPSVYNRYPSQNAPNSNSQGRSSGYGSTGIALVSEKGDFSHPGDTERPFKVLPNQHDCWDDEIAEQNGGISSINQPLSTMVDQPRISSHPHLEMPGKPRIESQENWGSNHGKDGKVDSRRRPLAEEASFHTSDHQRTHSSHPIKSTSHEDVGNLDAIGDFALKKLDHEAIGFLEVPWVLPTAPKDYSLIQKIEGLNAKARASDGRNDGTSVSNKWEEGNGFQGNSVKATHSANEGCGPDYSESHHVDKVLNPVPKETSSSSTEKGNERGAVSISRRSTHEVQNRGSLRERNKFNKDIDGLPKRSLIDSRGMVLATHPETSTAHVEHLSGFDEADSFPLEKHEGESVQPVFDSNVSHVQRAKMRELAKQRTKQLLEEEEERTRKQKAKAWAKLEELNRRKQAESEAEPTLVVDNTPSDAIKDKPEGSITFGAIRLTGDISGKYSAVVSNPTTIAHKIDPGTTNDVETAILCTETVKGGDEELVKHNHFVSLKQDVNVSNAAHNDTVTQVDDDITLKPKRMGYRHKQSIQSEKSSMEKLITDVHKPQNIPTQAADAKASLGEPSLPVDVKSLVDSSTNPRKKNSRSGKSKNKVEEGFLSAIPSSLSKETKQANTLGKPISDYQTVSTSVQSLTITGDANSSSDQLALPIEDSQVKGNGQGKSQHPHRAPRSLQGRSSERFHSNDAVIWAPVRPLIKPEVTDEANQKTEVQAISSFPKADQMQNNSKHKRAEMERYVPKPAAKEMAQQGSIQQPEVCSTNQTSDENRVNANSSENVRSTGSTTGIVGSASESRIGDGRLYKQIKSHRLWQQRGDAELTNGQGQQDRSAPKPLEGLQLQKASESYNDEWNPPDGWNIPTPDSFAPVNSRIAKDQGNAGKGKQHQHKGLQGFRNNFDLDQKKLNSVESFANETGQRDLTTPRESRGFGERTIPHWQPKSQAFPPNNRRGNRSNDIQNIKKELVDGTFSFQKDQCISENGILSETDHQESKTEKKISTNRGRPHSPNQSSFDLSSAFNKGEGHSSRLARGADTHRDLNSAGHDNKQHNPSAHRERPKNNFQYEYQPVGSHNSNKSNYSEGPKDNAGSRYRERARNNSRQGGANSRQVHPGADTSYD